MTMSSAYHYAAYFSASPLVAEQSQSITTLTRPKPSTLRLVGASAETTSPIAYNGFAWAAQHQFVSLQTVYEQDASIFFRLPAELRNEVYKELLCAGTLPLSKLAEHPGSTYKHEAIHPAILSTCRKIHDEAADLLYATPVFNAHPSLLTSLPHLTSFAKPVVCPSVLQKIRRWHLTIRLDTDPRFTTAQATAAFSGAEFVRIHVWQSMFDGCDASVLQLFTGVRGVKVARVSGSADAELSRWLEKSMTQPAVNEKHGRGQRCCSCSSSSHGKRGDARCEACSPTTSLDSKWFAGRDAWAYDR